MFVFFSSRLGWVASIAISIIVTIVLILIFRN